jgi:hypothetical protein
MSPLNLQRLPMFIVTKNAMDLKLKLLLMLLLLQIVLKE